MNVKISVLASFSACLLVLLCSSSANATSDQTHDHTSLPLKTQDVDRQPGLRLQGSIFEDAIQGGLQSLTDEEVASLASQIEPGGYIHFAGEGAMIPSFASGMSTMSAVASPPCEAFPSVVHKRTSGDFGSVGNKPYTRCRVAMKTQYIETTLRKIRSVWGTGSVAQGTFGGPHRAAMNTLNYTSKYVERSCTNQKLTTWYAVNMHVVVDKQNCPHYLFTRTVDSKLTCGT